MVLGFVRVRVRVRVRDRFFIRLQAGTLLEAPTTPTIGEKPHIRSICRSLEPTPPAALCTSAALLLANGGLGQPPASSPGKFNIKLSR